MLDIDDEVLDIWENYDFKWKQFLEYLVVLCESVQSHLLVSELEYELENHCRSGRTQPTTDTDDNKSGNLRETTTIEDKLKKNQ